MKNITTLGFVAAILMLFTFNLNAQTEEFDVNGNTIKTSQNSSADKGIIGVENIITTTADEVTCVHTGDIDGDGDIDVISASENDNSVIWYENTDGLGTFVVNAFNPQKY